MKLVGTVPSFRFLFTAMVMIFTLISAQNISAKGRSIFEGAPTEEQCRACHGDSRNQPHPLLPISNVNLHHLRVYQPIIGLTIYESVAPGDITTGEYTCISCHTKYNPESDQVEMFFTRDCLQCHIISTITGTPSSGENVHHYTDTFYNRDCEQCHDFLSTDSQNQNRYTYTVQRK